MQNYTPEQIAAMNDRNENFTGKTADLSKMRLYQQIKGDLAFLLQRCPDVYQIKELPPNHREQNAVICLDVSQVSTFDTAAVGLLAELLKKADRVIVSTNKAHIRFSFCVESVWRD